MIFDESLRFVDSGLVVHEPWLIETVSFGKNSVLGVKDGQYITVEKVRAFHLSCRHLVTAKEDMGGPCFGCFEMAASEGWPHPEWVSVKCKRCYEPSSQPWLARTAHMQR